MKHRKHRRKPARKTWNPVWLWVAAFLPVYLVLSGKDGYLGISAFKTKLLYGFSAVLLGISVIQLCSDYRRMSRQRSGNDAWKEILRPTPAQTAALLYLLFTLLSASLSPFGKHAWYDDVCHENAVTQLCYVLIFLSVSRWARPTRALAYLVLICIVAHNAVILLQQSGENPLGYYPPWTNYEKVQTRPDFLFLGMSGNADQVSAVLSLMTPICFGVAALDDKMPVAIRILAVPLGSICVYELIEIDVLAGVVGVACGLFLSAFVLVRARRRTKAFCLLGLGAAGSGAVWYLWTCPTNIRFFREIHSILHGKISDSFGSGRVFIWRQMLRRIPDQLWFGSGPDTVRKTGLIPFRRYDAGGKLVAQAAITDAHCLPLEILYTQGLFALFSWLATVGIVLAPWFRRKGRTTAAAILGAAIVCFCFTMLFDFSSVIVMPFFWVALGLLEAENSAAKRMR